MSFLTRAARRRRSLSRRGRRRLFRFFIAAAVVLFVVCAVIYERLTDGAVEVPAVSSAASAVERAISGAAAAAPGDTVFSREDGGYRIDSGKLSGKIDAFEEALTAALGKSRILKIGIPLGSLLESQVTSGRGPRVTARVFCDYKTACSVRSDISSVGINQTLYTVRLDVTVDCTLHLKGEDRTVSVSDSIILEEAVFIGGP